MVRSTGCSRCYCLGVDESFAFDSTCFAWSLVALQQGNAVTRAAKGGQSAGRAWRTHSLGSTGALLFQPGPDMLHVATEHLGPRPHVRPHQERDGSHANCRADVLVHAGSDGRGTAHKSGPAPTVSNRFERAIRRSSASPCEQKPYALRLGWLLLCSKRTAAGEWESRPSAVSAGFVNRDASPGAGGSPCGQGFGRLVQAIIQDRNPTAQTFGIGPEHICVTVFAIIGRAVLMLAAC